MFWGNKFKDRGNIELYRWTMVSRHQIKRFTSRQKQPFKTFTISTNWRRNQIAWFHDNNQQCFGGFSTSLKNFYLSDRNQHRHTSLYKTLWKINTICKRYFFLRSFNPVILTSFSFACGHIYINIYRYLTIMLTMTLIFNCLTCELYASLEFLSWHIVVWHLNCFLII